MPILNDIFGTQLNRYREALSLTGRRQSLLAENLANIDTPGYRRKDMDFQLEFNSQLKGMKRIRVLRQLVDGDSTRLPQGATRGDKIDLEQEVMGIAETQLRYQAISDFASHHISGLKTVIREGR